MLRNLNQYFLFRENSIKSVALYPVHSTRRGYPVSEGAHLAISKYALLLQHFIFDRKKMIELFSLSEGWVSYSIWWYQCEISPLLEFTNEISTESHIVSSWLSYFYWWVS